ncbi:GNAT family N-acetyltransferase [Thiofilum flexile]|uniref:GNAT family N-acetyltransferase n=1 Tax=Thiofilum flexile TaxID=125627 RepID=UPI00039EE2F7|nr:GNAT family N-acetyltransferase [Thiofilum flexile]
MAFIQTIVPLDKTCHDLKSFDCGQLAMNQFLNRFAVKHAELGLSSTWVLVEESTEIKQPIAAYYTLAGVTVSRASIPTQQSLPSYPIPVIMLARLAIAKQHQGKGLGAKVLISALRHAVQLAQQGLPAYGVILDALDDSALQFYQHFEFFEPMTDDAMRLFVSMNSLRLI